MQKKTPTYEAHREQLLKKRTVRKIYEEEMSKHLAEEAMRIVLEAKKELNSTHKRLKMLLEETA